MRVFRSVWIKQKGCPTVVFDAFHHRWNDLSVMTWEMSRYRTVDHFLLARCYLDFLAETPDLYLAELNNVNKPTDAVVIVSSDRNVQYRINCHCWVTTVVAIEWYLVTSIAVTYSDVQHQLLQSFKQMVIVGFREAVLISL